MEFSIYGKDYKDSRRRKRNMTQTECTVKEHIQE